MPGAISNPQLNPLQSYLDYTHQPESGYWDSYNRGYDWTGTTWAKRPGAEQVAPGQSPTGQSMAGVGYYNPSGIGGPGGITSIATGGSVSGPYNAQAQLAQVNSQFDNILKRSMGNLNEAAAISGGFSGGIPFENRQRLIQQVGTDRGAAIERILNDITGRNQAYALEKQRSDDMRRAEAYQSGSQHFGHANQNQNILELFQHLLGGDTGGGMIGTKGTKDMTGMTGMPGGASSAGGYSNTPRPGETGSPNERRQASSDFKKKYGWWPEPYELEYFMKGGT